jgi:hypothetical protein
VLPVLVLPVVVLLLVLVLLLVAVLDAVGPAELVAAGWAAGTFTTSPAATPAQPAPMSVPHAAMNRRCPHTESPIWGQYGMPPERPASK